MILAFSTLLAALPAQAEEPLVQGEILHGWQTRSQGQMAGLHLQLAPGWKTYWRAPGDAGIPPVFDWSRSDNVEAVRIHWPAPHVFTLNGLRTIGYSGDVVLPIEITPRDPGRAVHLRGAVEMGVCSDICVPATLTFDATIEGQGAPHPAISGALASLPHSGQDAGVSAIHCTVEPVKDGLRVEARLTLPSTGGEETVVIEAGQPGVWVDQAQVSREGRTLTAVTEMVGPTAAPFALSRDAMVVTVMGRDRVVEVRGCPAP
jgi:DsbC/DsbD-like thiol-disulfide interchange protein